MREILNSLLLRVRALLRRRELDRDLADEIAFHLEMKKERGGDPLPAFGNPVRVKEDLRDLWSFPALESVWKDIRYGGRALRKSPGFALVAVLSLAIGAGANTAMFSVVRAVMLKSLPVRDPGQLRVVLWTGDTRLPNESNTGYNLIHAGRRVRSSFPFFFYEAVRSSIPAFSDVIGFANYQVTVFSGGKSDNARARFVSGNFFDALGVAPLAGRVIKPQDDRPGAPAIAVATYSWWNKRFGMDPNIIGRTITVNRRPVVLAGVTPASFEGITVGMDDELFFPLAQARGLGQDNYVPERSDFWWVQMIARLRPGVDDREAASQLRVLMGRLDATADAVKGPKKQEPWLPVLESGAGGVALIRDFARTQLLLLTAVVVFILLIACANIANLMLARGAARRREIAVRLSIGASRGRLIRQLLTESCLIAFTGAAAGLALAPFIVKFVSSRTLTAMATTLDVRVDWSILAIAIAIAVATAILFGALPAIRATRFDLTPALKEGGAT
ncbi:MAG TPA: ABC transporter permease, partial [Bryobacteraceae bacterium]|nr:ABC transporter permease [Bryobacteraceae bacterium]